MPWAERWKPWDIDFRLYRRVIEIRDGRLALRPFVNPETVALVRAQAEALGLAGLDLQAAVETATLIEAVRAKGESRPSPRTQPEADDTPGGADLNAETDWLLRVANALTKATLTRAVTLNPTTS